MALSDFSLYELEAIAKRRGDDVEELRRAYWEDMLVQGKADREGSVRQQALRNRVFDQPVETEEYKPGMLEKFGRAWEGAFPSREAGPGLLEQMAERGYKGTEEMLATAGEAPRDIAASIERTLPIGESRPVSGWIESQLAQIRKKAEEAPVTEDGGLIPSAVEMGGKFTGEAAKMAPYLLALGPVLGMAAYRAAPSYGGGAGLGEVAKEAAIGAAEGKVFDVAASLPLLKRMLAAGVGITGIEKLRGKTWGEAAGAGIPAALFMAPFGKVRQGREGRLSATDELRAKIAADEAAAREPVMAPEGAAVEEVPYEFAGGPTPFSPARNPKLPEPPAMEFGEPQPLVFAGTPEAQAAQAAADEKMWFELLKQKQVSLRGEPLPTGEIPYEFEGGPTPFRYGPPNPKLPRRPLPPEFQSGTAMEFGEGAPMEFGGGPPPPAGAVAEAASPYTREELQTFAKHLREQGWSNRRIADWFKAIGVKEMPKAEAPPTAPTTPPTAPPASAPPMEFGGAPPEVVSRPPSPPVEPLFRGQRAGVQPNEAGVVWATPDRKYASLYGDVSEVNPPKNPLVVEGAGVEEFSKITGIPAERVRAEGVDRIDLQQADALRSAGYDAVAFPSEFGIKSGPKTVAILGKQAPPVEPPAVAPQAPQTGVPTKGVPPGREGERGSISLDLITLGLRKWGKRSQAVDEAHASAGLPPPERPFQEQANTFLGGMDNLVRTLGIRPLTEAEQIIYKQAENIAETGNVTREARTLLQKKNPELRGWYNYDVSPAKLDQASVQVVALKKELDRLTADAARSGDRLVYKALGEARENFREATRTLRMVAKSGGETVRAFQRVQKNFDENLRKVMETVSLIGERPRRLPLYNEIVELGSRYKDLSRQERSQLLADVADAWRMNLFSTTSFTLDLIGNLGGAVHEAGGKVGSDVWDAMTHGDFSMPGVTSVLRGLRGFRPETLVGKGGGLKMPLEAEKILGWRTVSGEPVHGKMFGEGWGGFTKRDSVVAKKIDQIVGAPVYAKSAVDTAFKRFGFWTEAYHDAALAARKQGLRGQQAKEFVDDYISSADDVLIKKWTDAANRVGFNRDLSNLEEQFASSTPVKFFLGAFPRWPFQFTRALANWVGVNPALWKKMGSAMKAGDLDTFGRTLFEYAGKSAGGLTGLYMLAHQDSPWKSFYENMDFKTMEYVDPDTGNRARLSGREPLSTAMVLAAAIRGDMENVRSALKFTSLPGASVVSGEGGLIWSIVKQLQQATQQREWNPNAVKQEVVKTINRLIPGQALLAAMETAFNPTAQEGIGANIPGVSQFLPTEVDPTTGQPLAPRQKPAWMLEKIGAAGETPEIPQVAGVPIPGAARILPKVHQLLSAYGLLNYKMPRRPVPVMPGGMDPKMSPEWQRRWYELYGAERVKQLSGLSDQLLEKRKDIPFGQRIQLINGIKRFNKLIKGDMSESEAGESLWGKNWREQLQLARQLESDLKIINKRDKAAMDAAFVKLTKEMRRARREGRQ